jgi:hypothetical protein
LGIRRAGEEGTARVGYPSSMGTRRFGRWWAGIDRYPTAVDTVVAVVLAIFGVSWFWLDPPPPPTPPLPAVIACVLLQCLPLGWRRRFPAAVLLVVTLGTILYGLAGGAEFPWTANPWLLAAYSAGAYAEGRWRDRVRGLAATAFVGYVAFAVFRQLPAADPGEAKWRLALFQVFTLVRNAAIVV